MTPLLKARELAIGGRLQPTDLDAASGELIALVGPNGGGKTSLLRALAGIEPGAGSVRIDGEDLSSAPPARRPRLLGFLPASREIAWPISVRDVIALGLTTPDPARIAELLVLLELEALAERPVDRLSTGERSRVLFARALAARPHLLLLDEPLSNLDPYWMLRLLEILRDFTSMEGCAAIVAAHDLAIAGSFDRVALVDRGRVAADGPPATVMGSAELADAFRIEQSDGKWRIRPGGRRSSP